MYVCDVSDQHFLLFLRYCLRFYGMFGVMLFQQERFLERWGLCETLPHGTGFSGALLSS